MGAYLERKCLKETTQFVCLDNINSLSFAYSCANFIFYITLSVSQNYDFLAFGKWIKRILDISLVILGKTADGKTVGLIAAVLWANVGAVEVQEPRARSGISSSTPEVAVRASIDGSTANAIDVP